MEQSQTLPANLWTPVETSVPIPVQTREQQLPLGELSWQSFEKLCVRLAKRYSDVDRCQAYGLIGQNQEGIDFLHS